MSNLLIRLASKYGLKAAKRLLGDTGKAKEEMVTLYRAVPGFQDINKLFKVDNKGTKYMIGNWGRTEGNLGQITKSGRKTFDTILVKPPGSRRKMPMMPTVPANTNLQDMLFTSTSKKYLKKMGYSDQPGLLVKFKVPKSYIESHGRSTSGWNIKREYGRWEGWKKHWLFNQHPNVIFGRGLPARYIESHKIIK